MRLVDLGVKLPAPKGGASRKENYLFQGTGHFFHDQMPNHWHPVSETATAFHFAAWRQNELSKTMRRSRLCLARRQAPFAI